MLLVGPLVVSAIALVVLMVGRMDSYSANLTDQQRGYLWVEYWVDVMAVQWVDCLVVHWVVLMVDQKAVQSVDCLVDHWAVLMVDQRVDC